MLGRFIQADTIVPNPSDPQDLNRYSYVSNNPLRYVDPSGHWYYDPGCQCLVTTKDPHHENAIDPVSKSGPGSRFFNYDETAASNSKQFHRVTASSRAAYCEAVGCASNLLPTINLPDAERWGVRIDYTIGFIVNYDVNVELTWRSGHFLKDLHLTQTQNLEIGPIGAGASVGPVFIMQEDEDPQAFSLAPVEIGQSFALGLGLETGESFDQRSGKLKSLYVGFQGGVQKGVYADVIGLTVDYGVLFEETKEAIEQFLP